MITIRTQSFNSEDLKMLIDAFTELRLNCKHGTNTSHFMTSLEFSLRFLLQEYSNKRKKESSKT